jgi:hypothetical protein
VLDVLADMTKADHLPTVDFTNELMNDALFDGEEKVSKSKHSRVELSRGMQSRVEECRVE